jgi:hypothetical protein
MRYFLYILLIICVNAATGQFICEPKCFTKKSYSFSESPSTKLAFEKKWESADNITYRDQPKLYDIDNDGMPELITATATSYPNYSNQIEILNASNGNLVKSITTPYFANALNGSLIIADIYNNCNPVIIITCSDEPFNDINLRKRIVCLNLNGDILWISNQPFGVANNVGALTNYGSLALADFNRDGIPEVYIYNEIYNAQTGVKLVDGGRNGIGSSSILASGYNGRSIAVNLDDDAELELAAGYSVYKVTINNINGTLGNNMIPMNISFPDVGWDPFVFLDGPTSVADIDFDGKLDIIVTTNGGIFPSYDIGIYCYTIENNAPKLLAQHIIQNGAPQRLTWSDCGIATIQYNKSKNTMDIFVSMYGQNQNQIMSLSYDGTTTLKVNWTFPIFDRISILGCPIFDFDNDGNFELLHRDENTFRVISFINDIPRVLFSFNCSSDTVGEYPLIGDFDNSGQSKICITCQLAPRNSRGKLVVFGPPAGQKWAPARKIWHQYAYNPLFINDDGTVPQYMHNPATYKNGKYNNFMVQESLIDEDGNYPVPAASLTGLVSCIDYDINTQQYTVGFTINNRADASASAVSGVPIAFYNGNPEAGGSLIGVYRTSTDITAGNTLSGLSYSFSTNDLTSLYMIVNTDKYPIIVSDTSYYDIDECDYTDNIFIAPALKFTESNQEICQGDSYPFYGNALTTSGIYYHELTDVLGCDSVIARLDLQVSNIKTESLTTSACDTYAWNGQTYTTDGAYSYQTLSVNGCDSITTLNLNLFRSNQINQNIQSCDTYAWNGQTYTQSGIYTYRTQNIHGCDSIVTLDLNVYPSAVVAQSIAACDAYIWNGQTYTQSGSYTYQTQTKNGCDSIITLDLTISNILRTNHPVTACDNYTWNGVTYDTGGAYTYSAQSVKGCDSIATLQLIIHPSTTSSLSQTACDAYTWNGQTYDQSGIYTYRTQNTFGCDSVATLSLTVNRASTSTSDINACSQYTWNGQTFTQSGTYTYSTQNRYGCDSITNLDLMIHPSEAITLQRTDCDSLVYLGRNLTQSGIYTFDLQNRFGCDSIITLDLTISGDKITSTQSACNQYLWPVNGQTYATSGSYSEQYTNALGCDSTYTLNLVIHPDYEVITDAEACAQYLWPVTNQRYTQSGAYTFPLKTAEGCDSILTLDLVIHPEFEFRDTVFSTEPYLWPINNKTYENSGVYTETFSTDISCDSIHYLYLTIKNNIDIFFPNIISPDGVNGFFTGYSSNSSVTIASLSIYDRWGNLMFAKENFPANDPQQGWDGQFQGKAVVQGVYTWLAIARLKDGSLETFVGDVTVVR